MKARIAGFCGARVGVVCCICLLGVAWMMCGAASTQDAKTQDSSAKPQDAAPAKTQDATGKTQTPPANPDAQIVGEEEAPPSALPANATPQQRIGAAWKLLEDAEADAKKPQTRILGLAALSMLRGPRAEKMITDAMKDPDVDVRSAAAVAAGQTKDRNLTTPLRNLLDDKEPQVSFTAAMTLWKMGDKSGEDILMSIAEGDRATNPSLMHGTEHKINRDLHDPGKLAKLGATQGAYMLLGPFGYGITAFQFIHQNGGNVARASAIESLAQEHIEPVHKALIDALDDKDATVRAAAAKGLVMYRDSATQKAVYALLEDPKQPVRLTAAAAYLRTTGTPGPPLEAPAVPGAKARHS